MSNNRTVSYRSSAVSSSASISRAIRDENYGDLPELVAEALLSHRRHNHRPSTTRTTTTTATTTTTTTRIARTTTVVHPLWEASSRGWTPVHVAAVGCPQMPLRWWKWILTVQGRCLDLDLDLASDSGFAKIDPGAEFDRQQQSQQQQSQQQQPPLLWTLPTHTGQTVPELFFRSALEPMPWYKHSLRERAGNLNRAIERLLLLMPLLPPSLPPPPPSDSNSNSIDSNSNNNNNEREREREEDNEHGSISTSTSTPLLEALRKRIVRARTRTSNHNNNRPRRPIESASSTAETETETTNEQHRQEQQQERTAAHSGDADADADVELIFQFWRKLEALLLCACDDSSGAFFCDGDGAGRPASECDGDRDIPVVALLATLPCCPELVARLAVALFPWQVTGRHRRRDGSLSQSQPQSTLQSTSQSTSAADNDCHCDCHCDCDRNEPSSQPMSPPPPLLLPLHLCLRSSPPPPLSSFATTTAMPLGPWPFQMQQQQQPQPQQRSGILPVLCAAYPSAAGIPIPDSISGSGLGSISSCRCRNRNRNRDCRCHHYCRRRQQQQQQQRWRLPLHASLARGDDWESIARHLFAAFPSAAATPDPATGLPCFALAVAAPGEQDETETPTPTRSGNRHHGHNHSHSHNHNRCEAQAQTPGHRSPLLSGSGSCWSYLRQKDRDAAIRRATKERDRQTLTTAYEVLRQNPSVLEGLR